MKKIIGIFTIFLMLLPIIAAETISFVEYNKNPVFDPLLQPGEEIFPCVVYDVNKFGGHGESYQYKMWYGDTGGSNGTLKIAYSLDGMNWSEGDLTGLSGTASHPVVVYDANGFGEGIYYKMWYWNGIGYVGSINSIRYAESVDGINWVKDQVIQQHLTDTSLKLVLGNGYHGNYFYHLYGPGYVIYNSQATNVGSATPDNKNDDVPFTYRYIMYYDSASEGQNPALGSEQIALAYSTDGIYWIRYGDQPVIIPSGNKNDWDGMYAFGASVVKIGDVYHLWYTGANGLAPDSYAQGIGYATSTDGINWAKDKNSVFHRDDGVSWRSARAYSQWVIFDSNGFGSGGCPNIKMWFSGKSTSIDSLEKVGYAYGCISSNRVNELPMDQISRILGIGNPKPTGEIIENNCVEDPNAEGCPQ